MRVPLPLYPCGKMGPLKKKIICLFVYWLQCVFIAACGFSLMWPAGATLCCCVRASRCHGFFCCETRALGRAGFSSCNSPLLEHRLSTCGPSCSLARGIFPDQDQVGVPCITRRRLNPWTSRETPCFVFLTVSRGIWDLSFPDQGSKPHPLQWKHRVLTTGLPGNFLMFSVLTV